MEQVKYIAFKNIAELRDKVNQLQEIKEKNIRETKIFLLNHGIPFIQYEDGTFGVDTGTLDDGRLEEYFQEFKDKSKTTREQFTDLGVVYMDRSDSNEDLQIDLQTRKN